MTNNYPTLQLGSTGNEVRILQQLLKILGLYAASITGSFDETTRTAVLTFQEENSLEQTGIVDQETWLLLLDQTSTPAPQSEEENLQPGDSGEEVEALQEKLKTTLYYFGEITGVYDTETEEAVRTFQLNNQVIATGEMNDATWYALDNAYTSLIDCNIVEQPSTTINYTIQKGDTLYSIAKKFNTTVNEIKTLNNLTSDMITVGNILKIPKQAGSTYTVQKGDTLYSIAKKLNITVDAIKKANNLTSDILSIGQILTIPTTNEEYITYTVKKGDTLYSIARNYNISVNELMNLNNLSTSLLTPGQTLLIPKEKVEQTYIVQQGDTLYSIAKKFNTTVDNLKQKNNLTSNILTIGQKLIIP